MNVVALKPESREHLASRAVSQFLEAGYSYGSAVPVSWFDNLLGFNPNKKFQTAKEASDARGERNFVFGIVRNELLEKHCMWLELSNGDGIYRVVMPTEQSRLAMRKLMRETLRTCDYYAKVANHVDESGMSDMERTAAQDARNHIAGLKQLLNRKRKTFLDE